MDWQRQWSLRPLLVLSQRPPWQRGHLKHAHRAVPYEGFGLAIPREKGGGGGVGGWGGEGGGEGGGGVGGEGG